MKRVLIISEYIAPMQAMGSIRWTKLGKYLAQNEDCEITVLTDEKDFAHKTPDGNRQSEDSILKASMDSFSAYHAVPNSAFLRRYYARKNARSARRTDGGVVSAQITPRRASFAKRALIDLAHALKDAAQARQAIAYLKRLPWAFDVVITTYGPLWPHKVGEWAKRAHPEVCWLADYRDLCYEPGKQAIGGGYQKRFARVHTGKADCIITVNAPMVKQMGLREGQRHAVITNGFDPADKRPAIPCPQFLLTYTGVLYDSGESVRDLSEVFHALTVLEQRGVLSPQDVRVCYAGGDGERFLNHARVYHAERYAEVKGVLPRAQALELQMQSAVLLVAVTNAAYIQGNLPGKFFEYILAEKPIVATVAGNVPNAEIARVLRDGALGCCYEQTRPEGFDELTAYIEQLYTAWKQTGAVPYAPDRAYAQQFSHPQLARHVRKLMDGGL